MYIFMEIVSWIGMLVLALQFVPLILKRLFPEDSKIIKFLKIKDVSPLVTNTKSTLFFSMIFVSQTLLSLSYGMFGPLSNFPIWLGHTIASLSILSILIYSYIKSKSELIFWIAVASVSMFLVVTILSIFSFEHWLYIYNGELALYIVSYLSQLATMCFMSYLVLKIGIGDSIFGLANIGAGTFNFVWLILIYTVGSITLTTFVLLLIISLITQALMIINFTKIRFSKA